MASSFSFRIWGMPADCMECPFGEVLYTHNLGKHILPMVLIPSDQKRPYLPPAPTVPGSSPKPWPEHICRGVKLRISGWVKLRMPIGVKTSGPIPIRVNSATTRSKRIGKSWSGITRTIPSRSSRHRAHSPRSCSISCWHFNHLLFISFMMSFISHNLSSSTVTLFFNVDTRGFGFWYGYLRRTSLDRIVIAPCGHTL